MCDIKPITIAKLNGTPVRLNSINDVKAINKVIPQSFERKAYVQVSLFIFTNGWISNLQNKIGDRFCDDFFVMILEPEAKFLRQLYVDYFDTLFI